jgi:hypothetical protein
MATETTAVLLKNSIRQLYQPTGHTSNWVTTGKMARKNPGISRESGCFTIPRRPVGTNLSDKPMPTITQHASIDDAIHRPAEWRSPRLAMAVLPQGQRSLSSFSGKDLHQEIDAPSRHATLHDVALFARMLLDQAQCQAA